MTFRQTEALKAAYGYQLINGTISDDDLLALSGSNQLKRIGGYRKPDEPATSDAHTKIEGVIDFVLNIGRDIPKEHLNRYVRVLIQHELDNNQNEFLRRGELAKYLLLYQRLNYSDDASQVVSEKIAESFNPSELENMERVIFNAAENSIKEFQEQYYPEYAEEPTDEYSRARKALIDALQTSQNLPQAYDLLLKADHFYQTKPELSQDLIKSLADTTALVSGDKSLQDYQKSADEMKAKPSKALMIIGALMMVIGAAVALTGFFTLGTTTALGVGLVAGGASLSGATAIGGAAGYGLFKYNHRNDISHDMDDVAESYAKLH